MTELALRGSLTSNPSVGQIRSPSTSMLDLSDVSEWEQKPAARFNVWNQKSGLTAAVLEWEGEQSHTAVVSRCPHTFVYIIMLQSFDKLRTATTNEYFHYWTIWWISMWLLTCLNYMLLATIDSKIISFQNKKQRTTKWSINQLRVLALMTASMSRTKYQTNPWNISRSITKVQQ